MQWKMLEGSLLDFSGSLAGAVWSLGSAITSGNHADISTMLWIQGPLGCVGSGAVFQDVKTIGKFHAAVCTIVTWVWYRR